ncbi:uncharacterized protein LOC124927832 [Impatiens glandulifera]|uniref:uncharacterized protein LOC124927832 n=1 Tax=Impatiens glandulifera TaxID=253017 RepID=UPI001FB0A9A0|nr:uncharacterized protein LOC124927832 [Impatiens glandulifera]
MDRSTPVRKPNASTSDLLTWSEKPQADSPTVVSSRQRSSTRSHQPSDGISKVVFGGQVTDEEVESLNKRKPCSGYKMKDMTGSGIFAAKNGTAESDADHAPSNKTGLRMYQQAAAGISHISFGEVETVSPKKPATAPEVAKQRELSGSLESDCDSNCKKQFSDAKYKELSGHDIFAPPPEILPRPVAARALALRETIEIGESAPRNIRTSVKVSNPAGGQQTNNLFGGGEPIAVKSAKKPAPKSDQIKGDAATVQTHNERPISSAKLREMNGSDIFSDGKVEARDYFGGVRKPPGGGSSIALV